MNLVTQKPGSHNCGQCCVAMLAGITRKQSCKVFGTKGGTTTKNVVRALKKLGLAPAERLVSYRGRLPARAMLCLKYATRAYGHWVVYYDGLIYCPGGSIYPLAQLLAAAPGTIISSYLTVPLV